VGRSNIATAIRTVGDLHYYLRVAIQLEHSTIPPYLVALYSIKPGANLDATNVIRAVVVEEMLHLTMAANVLNAVGGTPDLTYQGFVPTYPTYLPDGEDDFEVGRAALSRETVKSFLKIERPASHSGTRVSTSSKERKRSLIRQDGGSSHPQLDFYSIGEFYDAIIEGLQFLFRERGPGLFCGDLGKQVSSKYFYSAGGSVIKVHDLTSAMAAIDVIIEQGEGAHKSIENEQGEIAHYYRFEQLLLGRFYVAGDKQGSPSGEPLTVDWDAVYPIKTNVVDADYPSDSEISAASARFNRTYGEFLIDLTRAFNGQPDVLISAVGKMFHIKYLINELVRNQIPGDEAFHGAPTFNVNLSPSGDGLSPLPKATTGQGKPELFDSFLAMSVALTGFSEYDLLGTGLAERYCDVMSEIVGKPLLEETVEAFVNIAADSGGEPTKLTEALQNRLWVDPKLGPVSGNLVKLWYSGYWYQLPDQWRHIYGALERDATHVVSPESYAEGLLWRAVGSNPSGAKAPGYGTWSDPPEFA
jgi:hypothetical protein